MYINLQQIFVYLCASPSIWAQSDTLIYGILLLYIFLHNIQLSPSAHYFSKLNQIYVIYKTPVPYFFFINYLSAKLSSIVLIFNKISHRLNFALSTIHTMQTTSANFYGLCQYPQTNFRFL